MKVSIIIPTYKRPDHIKTCLEAIATQESLADTEVIVVDDGGDAETAGYIQSHQSAFPFSLQYFAQEKKGRSAARNLGISKALGEIIIFIGDDIVVTPGWLATHKNFHTAHPEKNTAAVGYMTWYPKLNISRYMMWLENGGPLLKFKGLHDNCQTDAYHFYTGNISLKKEILSSDSFDEKLDIYGWEDVELGARLMRKHGLRLYFLKNALAYHNHLYLEENLENYAHQMGFSAASLQNLIPDIKITPALYKKCLFAIIIPLKRVFKNIKKEWYWYAVLKENFSLGMKSRLKKTSHGDIAH
jgi:glycosyltransferase involved in cell wall biosynthesis